MCAYIYIYIYIKKDRDRWINTMSCSLHVMMFEKEWVNNLVITSISFQAITSKKLLHLILILTGDLDLLTFGLAYCW